MAAKRLRSHPHLDQALARLEALLTGEGDAPGTAGDKPRIVFLVGPSGVGMTSLVRTLLPRLHVQHGAHAQPHHQPVIHTAVPLCGEASQTEIALSRQVLERGGELGIDELRAFGAQDGFLRASPDRTPSHRPLRNRVLTMLGHRRVRVLVVEDAQHLVGSPGAAGPWDLLDDLIQGSTSQVLLVGCYKLIELAEQLNRVGKVSEVVHFQRYQRHPLRDRPATFNRRPTSDEQVFAELLGHLQRHWPSVQVPCLEALWPELMRASLGSVGLLKSALLRLASLQLLTPHEQVPLNALAKIFKCPRALCTLEQEALQGESALSKVDWAQSQRFVRATETPVSSMATLEVAHV